MLFPLHPSRVAHTPVLLFHRRVAFLPQSGFFFFFLNPVPVFCIYSSRQDTKNTRGRSNPPGFSLEQMKEEDDSEHSLSSVLSVSFCLSVCRWNVPRRLHTAVRRWWRETTAPPRDCPRSPTASWLLFLSLYTCHRRAWRSPEKEGEKRLVFIHFIDTKYRISHTHTHTTSLTACFITGAAGSGPHARRRRVGGRGMCNCSVLLLPSPHHIITAPSQHRSVTWWIWHAAGYRANLRVNHNWRRRRLYILDVVSDRTGVQLSALLPIH